MRHLKESGDTIIEVLLAISVVGFVLTGAFVATNRSTIAIRKSQERSEAVKYTESQVESLRSAAAAGAPNIFALTGNFCIDDGGVIQTGSSTPCSFGTDGRYKIVVSRTSSDNTFTVIATWDPPGSGPVETLTVLYRLHP